MIIKKYPISKEFKKELILDFILMCMLVITILLLLLFLEFDTSTNEIASWFAIFFVLYFIILKIKTIYTSISLAIIFGIFVFGMKFTYFIPYTFYALQNQTPKHYYSSDILRIEKNIKLNQYIETNGVAFPFLSSSLYINTLKKIFPQNIELAYKIYPNDLPKYKILLLEYKRVKKSIKKINEEYEASYRHTLTNDILSEINDLSVRNKNLITFDFYNNFLIKINNKVNKLNQAIEKSKNHNLRKLYPINYFQVQKNKALKIYKTLLDETIPKEFKIFEKELLKTIKNKMEIIYSKQQQLLKYKNIIYSAYIEKDEVYYQNEIYCKRDYEYSILNNFSYIVNFKKSAKLIGIIKSKKNNNWLIVDDNYEYLKYTLFLIMIWILAILFFSYYSYLLVTAFIKYKKDKRHIKLWIVAHFDLIIITFMIVIYVLV